MAFLNEQGLERLWAHIIAKLGAKVDKISGKGLSTNDYTDEDKNKLADVDASVSKLNEFVGDKKVSEQINEAIANKQDILTGTEGHVVQFDASGKPVSAVLNLIAVEDIDVICGSNIQVAGASEGAF